MATKNKKNSKVVYGIKKSASFIIDSFKKHAICTLSDSGKIINCNKTIEVLTGYTTDELVGKTYSIFCSGNEFEKKAWRKHLEHSLAHGFSNFEGISAAKNKTRFWCSFTMNPVFDDGGKFLFFTLIMQDITERKLNEEKKDEYLGIASHELRTPILSISLYSELLAYQLKSESDKKTLKIFYDMRSQIKRLTNLVDDLLVVNEIERNSLVLNKIKFNVNKFVRKIVRDFRATTVGQKIVLTGKVNGLVFGDESRLTQVLVNLIANGIKYSPLLEKVIVNVNSDKDKVIISVQDFGPGIGSREIRDIFRRYFRSYNLNKGNMPGLGLGLYISKQIMSRHGEKIWVKSKLGKGSTFYFSLSRAKKD